MSVLKGIINIFRFDKTNWQAVALCFLAATVFWFFNALNKEHTATISYPLAFQFDNTQYVAVKNLPDRVSLNITGSGWDLLRKSLGFKITPLQVTLEKPSETRKIPAATILPLASVQLGGTKINHVADDTLHIHIEKKKTKRVKLMVNPNRIRFELGYGLAGPINIVPDSALVEGPVSIIEKFPDSLVLAFPIGRISQNVKTEIDISQEIIKPVMIKPALAAVKFDVGELDDVVKTIKIIVIPSAPFRFQVSADSLDIRLRLPSKLKPNLKDALGLVAVVDLRALEPGVSKIVPNVKGIPDYVELLSVDSLTIRKY